MRVPVMFAVLALSGLAAAQHTVEPKTADERAVLAAEMHFERDSQQRGADAWRDAAAPRTFELSANARTPEELRKGMAEMYAQPGLKLTWQPEAVKVVGDLGIVNGRYRQQSGQGKVSTGTYVTIWQRQKDGTWKFVFDGGTPDNQ
jgi:ketosteroid isomerase-like protein